MLRKALIPALALTIVSLVPAPALHAQESRPWIHVHVDEAGDDGSKVSINLPLSIAEIAMSMAPDDIISDGKIRIDDHDVTVPQLRAMWNELRDTGDGQFVTVEGDENISISRKGDRILILVDSKDDENVRVDVPVSLVDALLSSEGDELNVRAALTELSKERGDILTVRNGEDTVRIWVDNKRS